MNAITIVMKFGKNIKQNKCNKLDYIRWMNWICMSNILWIKSIYVDNSVGIIIFYFYCCFILKLNSVFLGGYFAEKEMDILLKIAW